MCLLDKQNQVHGGVDFRCRSSWFGELNHNKLQKNNFPVYFITRLCIQCISLLLLLLGKQMWTLQGLIASKSDEELIWIELRVINSLIGVYPI